MRAAVSLPLFNPIRTAIVTNIAALTNEFPLSAVEERQLRFLRLAQRNLTRAGVPSLFTDAQILSSVTTVLGRAFPDGEFEPLLQTAIAGYYEALVNFGVTLSSNVSLLPPSSTTTVASNSVVDALEMLTDFDTSASPGAQTAVLSRAASRLRTAQLLASRPRSRSSRPERFTAIVDGRSFRANAGPSFSANYNPTAEFLTVTAREISGAPTGTRNITLYIGDVRPGTTSHSLGTAVSGTYAVYSTTSPTNSATYTSTSGNVIVTLDVTAGTVSGRFSFNADSASSVRQTVRVMSGDFSGRF
jgi:hypothetical protein